MATMIIVLAVVIPLILFPAAYVWYISLGGIIQAARERERERATAKAEA